MICLHFLSNRPLKSVILTIHKQGIVWHCCYNILHGIEFSNCDIKTSIDSFILQCTTNHIFTLTVQSSVNVTIVFHYLFRWAGAREGEVQGDLRWARPDLRRDVRLLNKQITIFPSIKQKHRSFPVSSMFSAPSTIHYENDNKTLLQRLQHLFCNLFTFTSWKQTFRTLLWTLPSRIQESVLFFTRYPHSPIPL